ncbi:MAG: hypothetical protein J7L44_00370, partial [Candidatus Diapherotrites archaeon]|nr:hypothetical protein [Candidatus Diapherotrites archaeon]
SVSSKKGILLVVIIIVAATFLLVAFKPPVKPEPSAEIIEADRSFDVDSNYFPEAPMTAIYLYENQLLFANPDANVLYIYLFWESPTEECEVSACNMFYYCSFDMETNRFALEDPFGNVLGPYNFTPGKVSDKAIEFPFGVKYRYFVSSDKRRFYLLLDKQDFALQFGKKLSFLGIDADLDGMPELDYFAPALKDFKNVKERSVAVFDVDSDNDGIADVKFFVSTSEYYHLIEPNEKYKWQVLFWAGTNWRGFNIKGAKKAPNGTVIVAEPFKLVIRMPA